MSYDQVPITKKGLGFTNVRCDKCNVELTPVFSPEKNGAWECLQPENALEIRLIGFYGGYFDSMAPATSGEYPCILLCKECADLLLQEWPIFEKAIKDHEI